MRNRAWYLFLSLSLTLSVAQVRAVGSPPFAQARTAGSPSLANVQLQSIACPDVRTCFVVGEPLGPKGATSGFVRVTHDGGSSWATVYTQKGLGFGFINCPDLLRCYMVGGSAQYGPSAHVVLLRTADGGKTWQRSTISKVQPGFSPRGLACPAATVCYVAGTMSGPNQVYPPQNHAIVMVTQDAGKNWVTTSISADTGFGFVSISCASTTACEVGGATQGKSCFRAAAIFRTQDGGKTWSKQFGDCAAAISALACPTALTCYGAGWYGTPDAVGNQLVLHTKDGGATWDDVFEGPIDPTYQQGTSNASPFAGVACPDPQTCFLATDRYLLATTDGGATWSVKKPVPNAVLTSIACPTTQICLSVGWIQPSTYGPGPVHFTGLILRTVDSGKTWTRL